MGETSINCPINFPVVHSSESHAFLSLQYSHPQVLVSEIKECFRITWATWTNSVFSFEVLCSHLSLNHISWLAFSSSRNNAVCNLITLANCNFPHTGLLTCVQINIYWTNIDLFFSAKLGLWHKVLSVL